MPDFKDLVVVLAGVRTTDRDKQRAVTVASHLVEWALKENYHSLSENERTTVTHISANRVWNDYRLKRSVQGLNNREAAKKTIRGEYTQLLNDFGALSYKPSPEDGIEVIDYSLDENIGMHGKVMMVTSNIKATTRPVVEEFGEMQTEPRYSVMLDNGAELHNLRRSQLHKF